MTQYESIRLIARGLANGESARGVCPFCHGGRHKEESFIVTRQGTDALYVCHRASCGLKGRLAVSGDPVKLRPAKEKPKEHQLRCNTYPLTQQTREALRARFEFTGPVVDYYGMVETWEGDIIIPIYNSRGLVQGHERKVKDPGKAKAIRYNGLDADGLGWYNSMPSYALPAEFVPKAYRERRFVDHSLIIVEDLYSAMKANAFIHSVALLSSHLSPEQAALIASMDYERVLLALDQDATAKAAALARRYRGVLPNLQVLPLRADIKDTSYGQVGTLIYNQLVHN